MPSFVFGGSKQGRAALAVSYVLLLCLAGLALLDLGALISPAAVPAMGGGPETGAGGVEQASGLIGQALATVGLPGLKYILGSVVPGLRVWEGTRAWLPGGVNPTGDSLLAAAFRAVTAVSLDHPASLLAAGFAGMRGMTLPSRGQVVISPERPGEGESVHPELSGGSSSGPLMPAHTPAAGEEPVSADARGGPLVAVYHTHAMESYLPTVRQVSAGSTGSMKAEDAFADDPEITVVRVGQELAHVMSTKYGIPNVHSRRFHDAGGRLGAYVESAKTVERLMTQYPTLEVLLDLHRDSPRRSHTTAKIGGRDVARILLLIGSGAKLNHPNWRANLAFANRLHAAMEKLYPGLSLGVMITESRYNQHYLPHAVIVEVGGVDNSMDEVLTSIRMFADALVLAMQEDTTISWPGAQSERK